METTWTDAREVLHNILASASISTGGNHDMFRTLIREALGSNTERGQHAGASLKGDVRGGLAAWQLRKARLSTTEDGNSDLTIPAIANECRLSRSQFNRAFRTSVGISPQKWLCDRRMGKAKWLLLNRQISISEVARTCGWGGQSHFTRNFTQSVGMAPGVWRRTFSDGSKSWQRETV